MGTARQVPGADIAGRGCAERAGSARVGELIWVGAVSQVSRGRGQLQLSSRLVLAQAAELGRVGAAGPVELGWRQWAGLAR